jgi:hypothetical protein
LANFEVPQHQGKWAPEHRVNRVSETQKRFPPLLETLWPARPVKDYAAACQTEIAGGTAGRMGTGWHARDMGRIGAACNAPAPAISRLRHGRAGARRNRRR